MFACEVSLTRKEAALKSFHCYDLYFSLMMGNVEMWCCEGVNIPLKKQDLQYGAILSYFYTRVLSKV